MIERRGQLIQGILERVSVLRKLTNGNTLVLPDDVLKSLSSPTHVDIQVRDDGIGALLPVKTEEPVSAEDVLAQRGLSKLDGLKMIGAKVRVLQDIYFKSVQQTLRAKTEASVIQAENLGGKIKIAPDYTDDYWEHSAYVYPGSLELISIPRDDFLEQQAKSLQEN